MNSPIFFPSLQWFVAEGLFKTELANLQYYEHEPWLMAEFFSLDFPTKNSPFVEIFFSLNLKFQTKIMQP